MDLFLYAEEEESKLSVRSLQHRVVRALEEEDCSMSYLSAEISTLEGERSP